MQHRPACSVRRTTFGRDVEESRTVHVEHSPCSGSVPAIRADYWCREGCHGEQGRSVRLWQEVGRCYLRDRIVIAWWQANRASGVTLRPLLPRAAGAVGTEAPQSCEPGETRANPKHFRW